jgi:hypothetical protein
MPERENFHRRFFIVLYSSGKKGVESLTDNTKMIDFVVSNIAGGDSVAEYDFLLHKPSLRAHPGK